MLTSKLLPLALFCTPSFALSSNFYLIGGVESYVSESSTETRSDKSGYGARLGVGYNLQLQSSEFLFSLGYGHYDIKVDTDDDKQKIVQGGIFYDLSYYFWEYLPDLQFGLGVDGLIAKGAYLQYNTDKVSQASLYMGPRFKYDFPSDRKNFFLTLQYDFDLNIPEELATKFLLTFGIKLGGTQKEAKVEQKASPQHVTAQEPTPQARVEAHLDPSYINFNFAKTELNTKTTNFLDQLAKILIEHDSSWQKLELHGHADQQGSGNIEVNQRISQTRARMVFDYLVSKGVAQKKLNYRGLGNEKPLQGYPLISAQQRRVELHFIDGVSDQRFIDAIKSHMK